MENKLNLSLANPKDLLAASEHKVTTPHDIGQWGVATVAKRRFHDKSRQDADDSTDIIISTSTINANDTIHENIEGHRTFSYPPEDFGRVGSPVVLDYNVMNSETATESQLKKIHDKSKVSSDTKEVENDKKSLIPNKYNSSDTDTGKEKKVHHKTAIVFKEKWRKKEARIRKNSPIGHMKGWKLVPVIVKSDDDLRQEQCCSQTIKLMNTILKEADIDCWLRPYDIIAISPDSGIIEAIPDTISISALRRVEFGNQTLLEFFESYHGSPDSLRFKYAVNNFIISLAGYSIVCYLLHIKDRHNGNILLDNKGHVIHIDFGFILGSYITHQISAEFCYN